MLWPPVWAAARWPALREALGSGLPLVLSTLLVAGCPSPPDAPRQVPIEFELPPPIAGGERDIPPALPPDFDPQDWELPSPEPEPERPWLRVFYSQDNRGELEPCGCPGSPTGGFARRLTWLREARSRFPDLVFFEGPSALSSSLSARERLGARRADRGRTVLEVLAQTGADAFFPGQADFAVVPPQELGRLARKLKLRAIATNLDLRVPGLEPVLVQERAGRRVAFVGLVRPAISSEVARKVPVRDPVEAIRDALDEVERAGPLHAVVAFTDAGPRELRQWLERGLPVDVLLAPPDAAEDQPWEFEGETLVVRSLPYGRTLRRLDLLLSGDPTRPLARGIEDLKPLLQLARLERRYLANARRHGRAIAAGEEAEARAREAVLAEIKHARTALLRSVEVGEQQAPVARPSELSLAAEIVEDPTIAARVEDFFARWMQEIQAAPPSTSDQDQAYMGQDNCVECHMSESAAWGQSPHTGAWASLVERGAVRNPECLGCHTTGFGQPGGFTEPERAQYLLNVQCEACHGPMELHTAQARSEQRSVRPVPGRAVTEATCRDCHDGANSPAFDYEAYRARIQHWK